MPTLAISAILEDGNMKFKQDIVKTLISELSFYPVGSFVLLNTGEIGEVIRIHKSIPTKPVIKLIYNEKLSMTPQIEVDLSIRSEYSIKNSIAVRELLGKEIKWL